MTKLKFFDFRNRKLVHFVLLSSMVVLQLLLLLVLYGETEYEAKVKGFEQQLNYSSEAKNISNHDLSDFTLTVKDINNFYNTRDSSFLNRLHLRFLGRHMDNLAYISSPNEQFFDLLNMKNLSESYFLLAEHTSSDGPNNFINTLPTDDLDAKSLAYRDLLTRIKKANTELDSLHTKEKYVWIADSIKDKIALHKEKLKIAFSVLNMITPVETKELVDAESPTSDIAGFFTKDLATDLDNCREECLDFIQEINQINESTLGTIVEYELLLFDMDLLLEGYKKAIDVLNIKTKSDLNKEKSVKHRLRIYRLVMIAILIILSLVLILYTRRTFEYERRLELAQLISEKNLKFKNRIVSMISHEIRSPLNIISIYCNSIVKRMKENDLLEAVKAIQFTTNSISVLANQVLKFSRSEDKMLKLNMSSFKLKEELVKILDGLACLVESSENEFYLRIEVDKQLTVNSDIIKIQELFYNIVGNANKFTQKGKIEVLVNCEAISSKSYKLKAQIKDNGIGMSDEDLKNVFEAYYQGVISEKVHNLGLGLGLNLCKELVELFNGDIKLESQLNKGTIVRFYIYLEKSEVAQDNS